MKSFKVGDIVRINNIGTPRHTQNKIGTIMSIADNGIPYKVRFDDQELFVSYYAAELQLIDLSIFNEIGD